MTWSRHRRALYGTLVLKATVGLHHGRAVSLRPPTAVRWCEIPRRSGALDHADDSAPFSGGGAVLVRGFLYAHQASAQDPALGRVIVGADKPMVDKVIASERAGKIPLTWEHALRTLDNPVGMEQPYLVDPRDLSRAIGVGPIAATWSPRVHMLFAPITVHDQILELPEQLDPRFFNPAPFDQQCQPFKGNEGMVLVNMVPNIPEFRTWLPGVSVAAQVAINNNPVQARFFLDTLAIDAEAGEANLVWRAVLPLPPGTTRVVFEATLLGAFEAPPVIVEVAPVTQSDPRGHAQTAPVAIAVRPPRVLPAEPRQLPRFPDPRRAVMERLQANASLEDLDLTGVDLQGLDLSKRSLARSKLDGANLRNVRLIEAEMWGVSLVGADLAGARLDGADLELANLSGAKAQKAFFTRANLSRATLVKARFDGATLDEADLSDCDATGITLMEAKLRRAKANRAKLEKSLLLNANFQEASLDFAKMEKSSLDDTSFTGASLADADLTKCVADRSNFEKARLARAKLTQVRFASANLMSADFTGADLEGADLTRSQLQGAILDRVTSRNAKYVDADLTGASLQNADLSGADLSGATVSKTDRSTTNLTNAKIVTMIE